MEFLVPQFLDLSSMRRHLRAHPRAAHDALDALMREDGWHTAERYGEFLLCQYAARKPLDDWAAQHLAPSQRPPKQAELICKDLQALGMAGQITALNHLVAEMAQPQFRLPRQALPLGLAWALAGASLGNKAILSELRGVDAQTWPRAFLSDPAMGAFWLALLPQLEEANTQRDYDAVALAANHVFDHFARMVRIVRASYPARIGAFAA